MAKKFPKEIVSIRDAEGYLILYETLADIPEDQENLDAAIYVFKEKKKFRIQRTLK